jgi:transcription elongation factor GreA
MNLSILVSQDKWQDFDDAWRERIGAEGPIDDLLVALRLAGDKKRISRCVPLAKEHAAALETGDRLGDAAHVIGSALVAGGNPPELTPDLLRLAEAAFAREPWWEPYRGLAGLAEGAPDLRGPWRAFAKMCAFQKGSIVYHPGGWGSGEVKAVMPDTLELDVTFWNGRKDRFPMNAAVDIFEPVKESDLRAQYFREPEELRKRAKKEPLEILRTVVEAHHGKATSTGIRNALMGIGIEGSAWSAWWRKARKLAENSEWFEVAGTPQKSTITLLLTAKDPSEALRRQLVNAAGVGEAHVKVRDLFVGASADPALVAVGLEVLAAPEPPDPSLPSEMWKLFQALPSIKDQERVVSFLPELHGEEWMDTVLPDLQHAAPGMVRPLVDAFQKAKRDEDLKRTYAGLLARPLRAPALIVALAAQFEGDGSDLGEEVPTPVQRAQALLTLATHLFQIRRGNPHLTRVCSRLTELMTGSKAVLRALLTDADAGALRAITLICARGIDPEIDHLVTEIALDQDRNFFAGQSGPFWDGDAIWTTKRGLERRSAELRELVDVKIPENQEAIGRAASFGDLSENSEWEAAIEEQRTLTSRAMAIEEELRLAELIENAAVPEDRVCPGTRVTYRESASGTENEVLILGPWDGEERDGTQIVSYRAPLAAGLLGLTAGETATVKLPSGELDIEVLGVEVLDL